MDIALPTAKSYAAHGWMAVVVVVVSMTWLVIYMYRHR
jgi:Mg2+ and Co2+ transporter CorA